MELKVLPLDSIVEGERFRKEYGEAEMEDLKASILREGIITPIAVMPQNGTGKYLLLAGGRRLLACQELMINEIPCRIFPDMDAIRQRAVELHENITRKDMSWQEETCLKKEIHDLKIAEHGEKKSTAIDAPGWGKEDTSKLLGESRRNTSRDIELASMINVIPELSRCKTKFEAQKLVKKMTQRVKNEMVAEAVRVTAKDDEKDTRRKKLVANYILFDAIEGMRKLQSESVNFIEIDPPYGIDLGSMRNTQTKGTSTMEYNEVDAAVYPEFLANVFKEAFRVLKQGGWLICWFGQDPWYEIVKQGLRDSGFNLATIPGAWIKNVGQTMNPALRMINTYELFFYASKGKGELATQGHYNTFQFKNVHPSRRVHPTERPVELIQELLTVFAHPGDTVLCPFLGSGNTILAAANLNMTCFGYDLSKPYKDGFTIRVFESQPGEYKSYVA